MAIHSKWPLSAEYAKNIFAYFVEKKRGYDQVSEDNFGVLKDYSIDAGLLIAIRLLHCQYKVGACVNGKQSKTVSGGCWTIGLQQSCFVTPHFPNLHELNRQALPN